MPQTTTTLLCVVAFVVVVVVLFLANAIRIVNEYQRLVVFRLGQKDPVWCCSSRWWTAP
jgi:regulator of protease activity HflC (stomatin/prohibitin superfamily)